MQESLPTDAISLLEEKHRFARGKDMFAAAMILLITFAIPVTITQFYKTNLLQSGAADVTPTPTQSYILTSSDTPTVTATPTPTPTLIISPVSNVQTNITGKSNYSFVDFLQLNPWILPLAGILLFSWGGLIFMYFRERGKGDPTNSDL